MHKTPIRWGILGCGDVTEVKSGPAYQQVPGFELCAVMARTPGKAADYAKRHGVAKAYQDAQALIGDPELDAIYIATPPDSHFDYALQVAKAGKICSVEKPMALNYGQCVKMAAAFEKAQKPLFVAYYRRSLPTFQQLKTLLEDGAIGQVRQVSWQYHRPASERDLSGQSNWRTDAAIAPGGYFDDIACHGLDILVYLVGEMREVRGTCHNQQGLYTAYDALSASTLFENGAIGSFSWNFGAFDRRDEVEILGDKGRLTFGIFSELAATLDNAQGRQTFEMPKPSPIQLDYVKDMQRHITGQIKHPSMAQDAAHTSWIMDNILHDN